MGIPTIFICSDQFVSLGDAQRRALGMPDLPFAVVAYPISGTDPASVEEKARKVAPEVAKLLVAGPGDK